tara:strand:+ start:907 stop:1320 length:414 start_codon:yes stop_codon:yes gene_type:complete
MPIDNKLSLKEDLRYGLNKEKELQSQIETITGDLVKLDHYNPFDFKGINCFVELKSRRNEYSKYPTTMVGMNKIKKARQLIEDDNLIYFCFNFTDGLYYWLYTENIGIEKKGGRWDRGKQEIKDYFYLPIEYLTKIV